MDNVTYLEFIQPIGRIVDDLGAVREQIKTLQSKEKMLKDQLLRYGEDHVSGFTFSMIFKKTVRKSLDTRGLKAKYGENWYQDHSETKVVQSIVTTRRK